MKKIVLVAISSLAFNAYADLNDVIKQCDSCHGNGGISTDVNVPTIAGIAAINISDALSQYQAEERPALEINGNDMIKESKKLDEETIEQLADYYAEKEFVPAQQAFNAKMVKPGAKIHKAKCEKCHSSGGSAADDEASILAGQHSAYLKEQIAQFVSGERQVDQSMVDALSAMNDKYINALLAYYASQQ